jgi:hypothetical protein
MRWTEAAARSLQIGVLFAGVNTSNLADSGRAVLFKRKVAWHGVTRLE